MAAAPAGHNQGHLSNTEGARLKFFFLPPSNTHNGLFYLVLASSFISQCSQVFLAEFIWLCSLSARMGIIVGHRGGSCRAAAAAAAAAGLLVSYKSRTYLCPHIVYFSVYWCIKDNCHILRQFFKTGFFFFSCSQGLKMRRTQLSSTFFSCFAELVVAPSRCRSMGQVVGVLRNGCSRLEGRVVQGCRSRLIDIALISLQQPVTSVPRLPALTQWLRAVGVKHWCHSFFIFSCASVADN